MLPGQFSCALTTLILFILCQPPLAIDNCFHHQLSWQLYEKDSYRDSGQPLQFVRQLYHQHGGWRHPMGGYKIFLVNLNSYLISL